MAFADRPYYRPPQQQGLGGMMTPGSRSITTWLIIVNVAVFFLDGFAGRIQHGAGGYAPSFLYQWGHFSFSTALLHGQIWRLVTYQFLHAGGWHLFGNMLMLFFFGPMVEGHLGSKRYLGFYLLCGAAGALMYLILLGVGLLSAVDHVPFLLGGGRDTALIGASAAVFGVLIGAWRIAPDATVLLFFIIPVPLRWLIMLILLVQVYVVMIGGNNAGGSAAHLGGLAAGWAMMARPHWLGFTERMSTRPFHPRNLRRKAKQGAWERKMKKQRQLEAEVDHILEKVSREGMHRLSRRERRTLREATERQRSL